MSHAHSKIAKWVPRFTELTKEDAEKLAVYANYLLEGKDPLANKPKLNKKLAAALRAGYNAGMSYRELAEFWDINPATVSRIVRGIYYKEK